MQPDKPNLELVETNELLEELHRRSRVFIYALRPLVKAPDDKYDFKYGCSTDGGSTAGPERIARGLGLMQIVAAQIIKDHS